MKSQITFKKSTVIVCEKQNEFGISHFSQNSRRKRKSWKLRFHFENQVEKINQFSKFGNKVSPFYIIFFVERNPIKRQTVGNFVSVFFVTSQNNPNLTYHLLRFFPNCFHCQYCPCFFFCGIKKFNVSQIKSSRGCGEKEGVDWLEDHLFLGFCFVSQFEVKIGNWMIWI